MATTPSGEILSVRIDTESEHNVLSLNCAKRIQVEIRPLEVVLRGFGEGLTLTDGEAKMTIYIDSINLELTALVTTETVSNVDLILGQPMLRDENIILKMEGCVKKLSRFSDEFRDLTLTEDGGKRTERLVRRTVLVPNTMTMVENSLTESVPGGIWMMPAKVMGNGRSCIAVAGSVLGPNRNIAILAATNLGKEVVEWPEK